MEKKFKHWMRASRTRIRPGSQFPGRILRKGTGKGLFQEKPEQIFQTTVDAIHDWIHIIDSERRLIYMNAPFWKVARELGLSPQIIGQKVSRAFPFLPRKVEKETNQVFRTGRPLVTREITNVGSRPFYTETTKLPVIEKGRVVRMVTVVRDITESRLAEESLRKSEEKFRDLFNHANDAILLHTTDGRILSANRVACERWGYSLEELMKLTPRDIDTPDEAENVPERIRKTLETEGFVFQTTHRRKDGTPIPTEVSTRRIMWDGETAILSVARDITDRKREESERQRLESKIRQTQKLESLGVLAGGIAHDFNNLLTVILGNADLALLSIPESSQARPKIETIINVSRRAAELCNQMLTYSGKSPLILKAIDLSLVVEEIGRMISVSISKKAVVEYRLAKGLPPMGGDVTQIRQVIMNLIINASEAIGSQNGTITITTGCVGGTPAAAGGFPLPEELGNGRFLFLEVSDSGQGMDEATLEKIYDPFFTTKFTGRGLGLTATLGIVRGHRGMIKVTSEPGRGSCFRVFFPVAEGVSGKEPSRAAPSWLFGHIRPTVGLEAAPQAREEKSKEVGAILVADDEEDVRDTCRRMLESLGYDVLLAADGKSALDQFQQHQSRIRCILLDLTMPNLDGEETFRELIKIDPQVRVVLMSGYSESSTISQFSPKCLAGFLKKPYQIEDLGSMVKKAIGEG